MSAVRKDLGRPGLRDQGDHPGGDTTAEFGSVRWDHVGEQEQKQSPEVRNRHPAGLRESPDRQQVPAAQTSGQSGQWVGFSSLRQDQKAQPHPRMLG